MNIKKIFRSILVAAVILVMAAAVAGCGDKADSTGGSSGKPETTYTVDKDATTLTVTDGSKEKVYTEEDVEKLGTETHTYSGRNKSVKNARFFNEFTGVDLKKLIEDAGFDPEGAVIKVICSDNFTKEYYVDSLYGLYAFRDNDSDDKTEVPAMIAIIDTEKVDENTGSKSDKKKYPAPFRLVTGQADWDTYTNDSQDYNVQNWASYIQYIEVSH